MTTITHFSDDLWTRKRYTHLCERLGAAPADGVSEATDAPKLVTCDACLAALRDRAAA